MRKLLFVFALFCWCGIQAKEVFVKGQLAGGIKVSKATPLPAKRCSIYFMPQGGSAKTIASPYSNSLAPDFIANFNVTGTTEFVLLTFESPGYEIYTKHVQIRESGGKFIAEIGTITLTAHPAPTVENVILTKNSATQSLTYQIYLANPTDQSYTFKQLKIRMYVKHDFSSAGLSNLNTADLQYKIDDVLTLYPTGKVKGTSTESHNPDYDVPMVGKIEFYKNQGLIMIELALSTHIKMVQKGDNYVQIELPKEMKVISDEKLVDDPLFNGNKITTVNFTLNTMKKTFLELISIHENVPTILYEKKHS